MKSERSLFDRDRGPIALPSPKIMTPGRERRMSFFSQRRNEFSHSRRRGLCFVESAVLVSRTSQNAIRETGVPVTGAATCDVRREPAHQSTPTVRTKAVSTRPHDGVCVQRKASSRLQGDPFPVQPQRSQGIRDVHSAIRASPKPPGPHRVDSPGP